MCHSLERFTDTERRQKALYAYNERVKLARRKKRAMETASVSRNEEHHHAVISVADGAKIQTNSETNKEFREKINLHKVEESDFYSNKKCS